MSGFLENLQAAVQTLQQEVAVLKSAAQQGAQNGGLGGGLGGLGGGLGGLGGFGAPPPPPPPPPPPANITADQITALIGPYVDNDAIKAQLGAAMRAMGINALPETQPAQYTELYQRFQNVISQMAGGGAGAGAQQQQNTSII